MRNRFWIVAVDIVLLFCNALVVRGDEVDDVIEAQMRQQAIPGLSLAVVDDGQVVRARGYGFADKARHVPVTTETLFQAGSVSKPVAAVGVLRLVEEHKLELDANVNIKLRAWKLPENEFTKEEAVTVRRLLCHGAGLTVHGFPGYAVKGPVPTLLQVLDGAKPANTEAIRVDMTPGSTWRYSGGGYEVLQQLIIEVTGEKFPTFMEETVLRPVGMKCSTYEQPLPVAKMQLAAEGFLTDGEAVEGGWHVYPEMAAAGLWTTAGDLARFAIALQRAYAGDAGAILSKATAHEMLRTQMGDFGLGVGLMSDNGQQSLMGEKRALVFCHGGRDHGFDANLAATATTGKAIVVLINKNDNQGAIEEIMKVVAKKYAWP